MFPHLYRSYINARGAGNLLELVIDLGFHVSITCVIATDVRLGEVSAAEGSAPALVAGRILERHLDRDYPPAAAAEYRTNREDP